ncbi:hypothetical protein BpHYR1_039735 [Brachionus plicatilis]|uniref:Uncharacterized protein n=1 Tax=Brachionus plicatilis TaxID=10195 RepID=A0A3M7T693_BRAPC|nr:hypothetical protein BpHYR1_039735 [Brachionus plicatilis]
MNFSCERTFDAAFVFEILSLKEQQLFKGFAFFGTLGKLMNSYKGIPAEETKLLFRIRLFLILKS